MPYNVIVVDERRTFDRVSVDRTISIQLSDGSSVKARMINISEKGLAILYGASAQVGAVLSLRFALSYKSVVHDISIKGTVKHSFFKGTSYCIGLVFKDPDEKSLENIRSFIQYKQSRITV